MIEHVAIKHVSKKLFEDFDSVSDYSNMSSDVVGEPFFCMYYDTINTLVREGDEDITKHDMAILTDLVSDPIGVHDDEDQTNEYPDMFMFGYMEEK